ncbi:ribosomal-protein-alanine acetyltransferase [Tsukamurella pulmonis]|uniref:Ribosomal-protein-alanine N-acetyltransferase n=1 Tax=Tsukamurella pulmonis TaxID=47312 RepID=A0A1H1H159_9ACTN|nr:ribosomal protein S18-alanine N-acetyltransferase [Tsukamurella pulmonis]RDH13020.1 ribosomal-protein-alanine N-acetyltransferase [Tsukamurella pulmonis]BDD81334.1 ribosomal-protein-alanine acetyltransferase [Tsukamurella pulmonis]SDR19160.1 ribosomal-protein-alanine N-acetyltransferase [Tsukamurella pulmonis]SUP16180.1 ribosomal-protein-alanine N-acetyltransferase [Tsukamurella pulmonis]
MPDIVIGELRPDEAQRCAELETVLFEGDSPWPASAFTPERHTRFFAARDEAADGRLVGYAGIGLLGNTFFPESEVLTIGVDPEYQGGGVGYALLRTLLDEADRHGGAVFLEVRTDNDPARTLYERNGFATVGVRKNYYRPSGADAYTMKREAQGQR